MICGGVMVSDNHLVGLLIFGELPEQRLALFRIEVGCCFPGFSAFRKAWRLAS